MYKNKEWKMKKKLRRKQQSKTKWFKRGKTKYKSIIFVPATPNSKLQKEYSKIIQKHKIDIKVVEKAGKQLKTILQTSDPFKQNKCQDEECFPCKSNNNDKLTNCREDGIIYKIKVVKFKWYN